MAACTPSIHVFLGRPLFLLSVGVHSIINFGILKGQFTFSEVLTSNKSPLYLKSVKPRNHGSVFIYLVDTDTGSVATHHFAAAHCAHMQVHVISVGTAVSWPLRVL